MSNDIIKLQEVSNYNGSELTIVKNQCAVGTSDLEFAYFLSIAKASGLNPLAREIWCYPQTTKTGRKMVIFAGKDGFLRKAQEMPNFSCVNSCEVCANDKFDMGVKDGEVYVNHGFGPHNRGGIIGAYAIVKLKDGGKVVEWADIKDYDKKQNAWNSHQAEMIKKVATTHALKKITNLSGVYAEEDFEIRDGKAFSREAVAVETNADALREAAPEKITDEQKNRITELLQKKGKTEKAMLEHYKKETMDSIAYPDAQNLIAMLERCPDAVNVVSSEKTNKSEQSMASQNKEPKSAAGKKIKETMDANETKKQMKAEMSARYNELMKKDSSSWSPEENQFLEDFESGKFN